MGCFPCFDSREAGKMEDRGGSDEMREKLGSSQVARSDSGGDEQRTSCNESSERGTSAQKDKPGAGISARVFTFQELATATKNFRPECFLGEGGFGRVYKGWLENSDQVVAVKRLDKNGLQGNREFLVEVLLLSLLHHPNLVNLIGYCADGDQRLLVYEFMPLGSLENHLHDIPHDKEPLDWNTRMKIAAGAAKGLEYLHDRANPPVIYRDFKSSNILLDEGYHAKLSDFGLAKLGPIGDKSHVSTRVMGTYGYCAPDYAMTGQLTVKSDIYSFGVVLLELITGRKAIDSARAHAEQNLVSWARPMFNDRKRLAKLADPRLQGRYPMRGLYQALAVASMCLQPQAAVRPLIADVVTALTYLAIHAFGPSVAPALSEAAAEDQDGRIDRNGAHEAEVSMCKLTRSEDGRESGCSWGFDGSEREDSPHHSLPSKWTEKKFQP